MASPLDSILDIVKRKVSEASSGQKGGPGGILGQLAQRGGAGGILGQLAQKGGAGGVLGQLTNMLGQRGRTASASASGQRDVRPASEDPYGDPADGPSGRKVKPASEDPYGDPADEKR